MAFKIPNEGDAAIQDADQSEPDSVDIDILVEALKGNGVVSGAAVTEQTTPDMTVQVASGVGIYNGSEVTISADSSLAIGAADGTNPRYDLVAVNTDTGAPVVIAGTAAANPLFPTIPANRIILAAVLIPASDTTITDDQIVDKRAVLNTHKLLSPHHSDVVAASVVRGDLVIGDATPEWARLPVGAANSVLWSDGTDPSWTTSPRLASISDTGGTARIKTSSSNPHVEVDDTLRVERVGIGSTPDATSAYTYLKITPTATIDTSSQLVRVSPTFTLTANETVEAIQGLATVKGTGSTTGAALRGLNFEASAQVEGVTSTWATLTGIDVLARSIVVGSGTITATTVKAVRARIGARVIIGGSAGITTGYSIHAEAPELLGGGTLTDYYGAKIDDTTGPSGFNRLLEVGPSTPYLRIVGNFTAAADETPVYISEGATPTLRQLKTVVESSLDTASGTKLICYLN